MTLLADLMEYINHVFDLTNTISKFLPTNSEPFRRNDDVLEITKMNERLCILSSGIDSISVSS